MQEISKVLVAIKKTRTEFKGEAIQKKLKLNRKMLPLNEILKITLLISIHGISLIHDNNHHFN